MSQPFIQTPPPRKPDPYPHKIYVGVYSFTDETGRVTPHRLRWEDGTEWEIDKVLRVAVAASLAGGAGIRYTVRIGRHERYLFLEPELKWFVETEKTG